jgi:uncharacterized protein YjiS (DUF1127 family)
MAYSSLFDERPDVAAASWNPARAFFAWVGNMRSKHAQRVALSNLLDLDGAMLDDLGIERADVIEALQYPTQSAGARLSARRARNARYWLTHP